MRIRKILPFTLLVFFLVLIACESSVGSNSAATHTPRASQVGQSKLPQVTVHSKWDLWASGTTLLRGANIWQSLVVPEVDGLEVKGADRVGPPFFQKDFDQLATMGANYVVLSIPGLFTENPPYQVDEKVQKNLDNLLEMVAKADLFATIAFRTGPGRAEWSLCCNNEPYYQGMFNDKVWVDEAAQQAWAEMWRYTAERYRNNPVVVGFELMVEPDADDILLNIDDPQEFYPNYANSLYDWNAFYPILVDAIRAVDQETPILVGGMGYSSIQWLPYLKSLKNNKIIYDVHQYVPFNSYTHQEPSGRNSYPGKLDLNDDEKNEYFDQAWLKSHFQDVREFSRENQVPMAINEFGIKRWGPNADRFMFDQMQIFEEEGWNYALWEWSTSYAPFSESQTEFNFRLGPEFTNHKQEVSNSLMDTIQYYWDRNMLRPSMVNWTQQP